MDHGSAYQRDCMGLYIHELWGNDPGYDLICPHIPDTDIYHDCSHVESYGGDYTLEEDDDCSLAYM